MPELGRDHRQEMTLISKRCLGIVPISRNDKSPLPFLPDPCSQHAGRRSPDARYFRHQASDDRCAPSVSVKRAAVRRSPSGSRGRGRPDKAGALSGQAVRVTPRAALYGAGSPHPAHLGWLALLNDDRNRAYPAGHREQARPRFRILLDVVLNEVDSAPFEVFTGGRAIRAVGRRV